MRLFDAGRQSKIAFRFVGYLLLVALLPLCVVGYVALQHAEQTLQRHALDHLTTIADNRAQRMADYFFERNGDARTLSRLPVLTRGVRRLATAFSNTGMDSELYRQAEREVRPLLNQFRDVYAYADILLISAAGDVLFSVNQGEELSINCLDDPYRDTPLGRAFDQARMLLEPQVSDYRHYAAADAPVVFVAVPVFDVAGHVQGVLALRLANRDLHKLAQDYTGLRDTGETVLATRIGDDAVMITPLRGDPQAAFQRKVKMGAPEGVPIQEALKGRKGYGVFTDYRGESVLAVWRYLPSPRWGMVIKMDTREIYADISELRRLGIIALCLTFFSMVLCALYLMRDISRKVSDPLRELTKTAQLIAGGDLSHTLTVTSQDEIGELAGAFNQMTANVKEARTQVQESYDALEEENRWKTELVGIRDVMSGEKEPEALGLAVLQYLAPRCNATVGTFFVRDPGDVFRRISRYACADEDRVPEFIKVGEGLIGQAVLENRRFLVSDVPDDYLSIRSSLGETTTRSLIITPIPYEQEVIGVIELGLLQAVSEAHTDFLEQVVPHIGISLHSAMTRKQTRELLAQTRAQTEVLQEQQEELRVANEELEEQTRALMASQEELQTQQEELQVTNEELEEQKKTLELQKRSLEETNHEVEKARRTLDEKARQLTQVSQYKSEFMANMSHELRTPLNSLLILARLLSDNSERNLTARQVEFAQTIHRSGSELLDLISDILDLSKVEAGKLEINPEETDLQDFLEHIEQAFGHLAGVKELRFVTEMEPGLPVRIRTDPKRVEQILKNLLSNACKFCEKGQVSVTIGRPVPGTLLFRTGLTPEQTISIAVSDTGIGIPREKQSLIFEAFQQAEGTTGRRYGGTGLGLSISRELAWLLGGEIGLESEVGKGSTFTLYLPEKMQENMIEEAPVEETVAGETEGTVETVASEPEPVLTEETVPSRQAGDDREGLTQGDRSILIVEDDPRFASILADLSEQKGFKKLLADSGPEGLKLADMYRPSAILLDIILPGMDGLTVMERLKENPNTRYIPVHFISAREETPDALSMGAIGYLKKPVSLEDLDGVFKPIEDLVSHREKHLLVVEDDRIQRQSIIELIEGRDTKITAVDKAEEAYALLCESTFDCMILDLGLTGTMSAFELLERIQKEEGVSYPPVIVYTGKDLSREEEDRLHRYAQSIVIKGARSPERLLDEVTLFLHRVEADLPAQQRKILRSLHTRESVFEGRTVLLVDDDMRNLFALTHVLEEMGMSVLVGKNGREAVERLNEHPEVDLVLLDIMMPEMDGYEAMSVIRKDRRFEQLPIIALTAKAMKGDREKCLEAGANDYLAKPVDVDRMLSLLRVWLHA